MTIFFGLAVWKSYAELGKWLFNQDVMYKNEEKENKLPTFLFFVTVLNSYNILDFFAVCYQGCVRLGRGVVKYTKSRY